ncbi:MAG: hypothetical protein P1V36_01770 [Planctomycetota bacterium]|nr:hypothetical protein [Planctomycetota bacterium]
MSYIGDSGLDPRDDVYALRAEVERLTRDEPTRQKLSDELAAMDKKRMEAVNDTNAARAEARQAVRQNDNLTQMLCLMMGTMHEGLRDDFAKTIPGLSYWWSQHKKLDEAYAALSKISTEELDRFFGMVRKRRLLEQQGGS